MSLIERIKLQIRIIQIQIAILLLRQKRTIPNLYAPNKIILHHGGGWLNFKGVDYWHKIKWGFKSSLGYYCGYTYFIERSGKVIQARRDNEEGAHTKGYNQRTIGIGLMGNGVEKDFTRWQYISLEQLVNKKTREYNIIEVVGHNKFSPTLCPSSPLEKWLRNYGR